MADRVTVTCGECQRTFTVAGANRRNCTYCGAPLFLPAETPAPPERKGPPILVECPLCAHSWRVKGGMAGRQSSCSVCGCPYVVPETDGLARLVPVQDRIPTLEIGTPLRAACPKCGESQLRAANDWGSRARCGACDTEVDATGISLDRFAERVAGASSDPIAELSRAALRTRWRRGEVSLAESTRILSALDRLGMESAALTPLLPLHAAEVAQWAVFFVPEAMIRPGADGVALEINVAQNRPVQAGAVDAIAAGVLFGAMGAAIAVAANSGSVGGSGPGLVRLLFVPVEGGSDMTGEILDREGGPICSAQPRLELLRTNLAEALLPAAQRYYAFKAIFGSWTTGTMYQAVNALGMQRRLESFGPEFAKSAAQWAAVLAERRTVPWAEVLGV